MTVTTRNRYIGQLTPRQRAYKAAHTPPKRWTKVRHIDDMEQPHSRLIPKYK